MKTLLMLYFLGHLVFMRGSDMPITTDVLGFQAWTGGLLAYGHREKIPALYDIKPYTIITGVYSDGSSQRFKLVQRGELPHLESKPINETYFMHKGKYVTTSTVLEYFSSPDSITIYTCWPKSGELQGGLFLELAPIIEVENVP